MEDCEKTTGEMLRQKRNVFGNPYLSILPEDIGNQKYKGELLLRRHHSHPEQIGLADCVQFQAVDHTPYNDKSVRDS